MTEEELKPCPFCGESGHIHISQPYNSLWCVACFHCDCCVGWSGSFKTKEQAIVAWNKRVSEDALKELEDLRQELKITRKKLRHCESVFEDMRNHEYKALLARKKAFEQAFERIKKYDN